MPPSRKADNAKREEIVLCILAAADRLPTNEASAWAVTALDQLSASREQTEMHRVREECRGLQPLVWEERVRRVDHRQFGWSVTVSAPQR